MFLSNRDVLFELKKGKLKISPLNEADIQPASVDIHLDRKILVPNGSIPVDPDRTVPLQYTDEEIAPGYFFALAPGKFVLGTTIEVVTIPDYLVCRIEGVSSRGREGLSIHTTAGWVDPGFTGKLTLEMYNAGPTPYLLRVGQRIGQLSFAVLRTPANPPYQGRYQGQTDTTGSK